MKKITLLSFFTSLSLAACAANTTADSAANGADATNESAATAKRSGGQTAPPVDAPASGDKPICPVPEPIRRGAEYTRKASFSAKVDAYQSAVAAYEVEHPEAAEYASILKRLSTVSCLADSDCATGSDAFTSSCMRYVWTGTNGTCSVSPVTAIPLAPPAPVFTCDDVTCPSGFQCEVENHTLAVGCVELRTCVPAGGNGHGPHSGH